MTEAFYPYDFAICAIFQNEGPYLKEWIEYHKIVGAKHFYLYNNYSQDNYLTVLKPYISSGTVELVDWIEPDFQSYGQRMAYMDAIYKARGNAKWLALIDIDEYLVPKTGESIPEFLTQFEKEGIGGVAINWQMFGTSYVTTINENQLLTEVLTLKAVEEHSENEHIKSIVRPEYVVEPPGIHNFNYREGYVQVNTDHESFSGPISPYIAIDKMQINHYWAKDEAFFNSVKIPSRLNWDESIENIENRNSVLNKVHDSAIEPFLPTLRQKMFSKGEVISTTELNEEWNAPGIELSPDLHDFINSEHIALSKNKSSLSNDNHVSEVRPLVSSQDLFQNEQNSPLKDISDNEASISYQEIPLQTSIIQEIIVEDNWIFFAGWPFLCCVVLVLIAAVILFRLKSLKLSRP